MAQPQLSPTDLDNAADLMDALKRDKLQVVELYADWTGPTQALPTFWRRLAMEHGSTLPFDCSTACFERCREAAPLASHHSTSQPQFLLFKGGKQVAYILGVDPPSLMAAINKQLAVESGVGAAQRHDSSDQE